jgi:hypothetical protein
MLIEHARGDAVEKSTQEGRVFHGMILPAGAK